MNWIKVGNRYLHKDSKIIRNWRRFIKKRDGYTCQLCGYVKKVTSNPKEVHAHHIKPLKYYPESALDYDNGITLCESCHRKTHKNKNGILGDKMNELKQLFEDVVSKAFEIDRKHKVGIPIDADIDALILSVGETKKYIVSLIKKSNANKNLRR